jgi:hypothetical protein
MVKIAHPPCKQRPGSQPPVCAVHGVKLVKEKVEYDGRQIECLVCPASGAIVN